MEELKELFDTLGRIAMIGIYILLTPLHLPQILNPVPLQQAHFNLSFGLSMSLHPGHSITLLLQEQDITLTILCCSFAFIVFQIQ